MDIENLVDIFSSEIIKNKPELKDFSKGSVLYTLARAIALTANEVYQEIEIMRNESYLLNNSVDLELLKSLSPSVNLQTGSFSQGFILATNLDNNSLTIPINTPLTDPITSNQFFTTSTVVISNLTETQIPVVAGNVGTSYNLLAGKTLINVDYPRVVFIVGSYRQIDGSIVGDISGGVNNETWKELEKRLKDRLFNLRVTNRQALVDYLLSQDDIVNVELETLRGGIVNIWLKTISTISQVRLDELNNSIKEYLPVGVLFTIKQLTTKPINIRVQTFEETNLIIDSLIKDVVSNYVTKIKPSQVLTLSNIRNLISERTGLVVKILEPSSNITLGASEKFEVVNMEVLNAG